MNEPDTNSTGDLAAVTAQHEMLESCLDLVFGTYDEARGGKMTQPVIFLLDCEDEIGRQIADAWLGVEAVSDAIATQHAEGQDEITTVFARAVSYEQCREEVPDVFPYLAPAFDLKPPADGFLAIAVTAGGASIFTVPHEARKSNNG